ncbi:DUF4365 domain-containing protein [Pseudomonas juntendi]|uniref:DUF4365 domain-containing protein n=1 Tax=Pseudomonas juntendi TaxID=2666183 RepID=A0A7W2QA42_9PSED|nr:DUF4365 domain-containing protein [Pseudomonas juntendi]MBA6098500.1 DUF4365 domain-containing protein [Pseudomonas juntendi]
MHYTPNQQTGDTGELIVKKEFVKLFGWPYRRQEVDLGIDAEFETLLEGNLASGRIVKVQVKATSESFVDGINTVYPKPEHVEYWKTLSVPVILCAVSTTTEEILWKVIEPEIDYSTPKGTKVEFDRAVDKLDISAKSKLERIATFGNSIILHLAEITSSSLNGFFDERGNGWLSIENPFSLEQHAANEEAILIIYRLISLSKGRVPPHVVQMVDNMNRLWNQLDLELHRQRTADLY